MTNIAFLNDSSLQLVHHLFDLVDEGVLWVDASGSILQANARSADLLGYKAEDLQHLTIFQIDPHYSLLKWKTFWKQSQDKNQVEQETALMTASGLLLPVQSRFQLISSGGNSYGVIVFKTLLAQRRYRDLLDLTAEQSNLGTWELDLISDQFYLCSTFRKLTNLTQEIPDPVDKNQLRKLVGKRLKKSDMETLVKNIRKALKDNSSFEQDLHYEFVPSEIRRYAITAQVYGNELNPLKLYGTIRDTSVLSTDNELRYLQQFSLDHNQDMIVWTRPSGDIQFVNLRTCQLLGFTKQELFATPVGRLVPNISEEERLRIWERLRHQKTILLPIQVKRKDGTQFWVDAQMNYMQLQGEEFNCSFLRDITERQRSQRQLQLGRLALNHFRDWVIWLDEEGHITQTNRRAAMALEAMQKELIGLPITTVFPDVQLPAPKLLLQPRDSDELVTREVVFTPPNGQEQQLLLTFTGAEIGDQYFYCLTCSDITEIRRRERELQAAQEREMDLKRQLQEENELLREEIDTNFNQNFIVTVDPAYKPVLEQVSQVAETDATVLITGETGTGKELLARYIHTFSDRAEKTLISVNCAALPESLIESELFGHEKGAFTGAYAQKKGRFELAHQGTIFLDEIGEVPLDVQAKLLRVLQEGEFQRVGGTKDIKVDVRIITATNRDLEEMIANGRFREDLFYRLNVFPIRNLALRERRDDIPVLIKHFTKIYATKMGREITHIPQTDLEEIKQYDFPGNVRELINVVERAVILTKSDTLNLHQSFLSLRRNTSGDKLNGGIFRSFEDMQRDYIIEALKRTKGRVTGPKGAAALLKINGRTLMSKMRKLEIDRSKYE